MSNMMHMPWVLVTMMVLLVLLLAGTFLAVRLLAAGQADSKPDDSDATSRPSTH